MRIAPPPQRRTWELTTDEVDLIKKQVCPGATDDELKYNLTVARRHKLDPFQGQIWFVPRRADGEKKWVPIVGIHGLLHIAARDHRDFGAYSEPEFGPMIEVQYKEWSGSGNNRKWEWAKLKVPEWAKVSTWKKGMAVPTTCTVYWEEIYKNIDNSPTVRQMPRHMLAKCARAHATRAAYPSTGGLYIAEEFAGQRPDYTPDGREIVYEDAPTKQEETASIQSLIDRGLWCVEHNCTMSTAHTEEFHPEKKQAPQQLPQQSSHVPTQGAGNTPVAAKATTMPAPSPSAKGTVEIDWVHGTDKPAKLIGDVSDLILKFKDTFAFQWKDDWNWILPADVRKFGQMAKAEGFTVYETFPSQSSGEKPAMAASPETTGGKRGRGNGAPAPTVVVGTIQAISEKMTHGNAKRPSAPYLSVLIKSKGEDGKSRDQWYSVFDRDMFEFINKGKGKEGEFYTAKSGDFFNVVGLKRIGPLEFEEGKLPVIQNKDREAGGSLFK